ncbi:methyltransferase, partial [Streptomyces orinoci]
RQAARDPTEPFTLDDLACAGMAATHTRLMKVLLAISAEHQVLAPLAGTPPRWQLTGQADASRALRDALREHPALAQQLTLYAYCGRHLPELLRGDRSPHDLLFAGADRHLAESFAAEPVSGSHLDTIAALVSSILTDWPPDRPLRILQVGARTLELTGKLLEFLPPERTEYLVTDASAGFLRRSRHRFAGHGLIEHRPFDPDLDPGGQGYANRSFDLVLAHQSLHPARDLRRTVTALAGLLIPGGLLIGVEPHDLRATVLWRGLRPDFWSFTDSELRFSSPLLSAPAWQDLLTDCGFAVAHAIGTEESSVLLARRPPAAALTAPPPPALPSGAAHWILAAERPDDPLARQLAALLTESGAASVCRTRPADKTAQWQRSWQDKRHPLHIVLLLDDTAAPKAQEPEAVTESAVHRTASLAAFARAQAGCTAGGAAPPVAALWLVARSPAALAPPGAPELAAPWAAARWLAKEHPAVAVRRIALAADPELPETARRLALELLDPTGADELLLTATGRFTVRTGPRTPPLTTGGPDRPYRPEVRRPAPSYHPSWTPAGRPAGPGPHQVLIEARALGLNPRAARRASGPALECAGTVVAVGSAVRDLAPGDRVCALGTGIPGHHALARRQLAGRIPDTMAFTEAATLPLAFLTARRALDQLARLAPGETLLLHHATGGTGLAAARLAHQRGARVIATADTPAQRDLLRLLGVDGVLDPHHP